MNRKRFQVIGLLFAAMMVAAAETRTWTFEKSGKTLDAEVVGFDGDSVILKRPDGQRLAVRISYLIESNRAALMLERANQWKDVEVVKIESVTPYGYKCGVRILNQRPTRSGHSRATLSDTKITVRAHEEILIRLLPNSVQAVLAEWKRRLNQISEMSKNVWVETVHKYDGSSSQYLHNKTQLQWDLEESLAKYIIDTRPARIVKMKNCGIVFDGMEVWECRDPIIPNQ